MPERYKPEPAYDSTKWPERELEDNGEDPLVELARLVSGIGSAGSAAPQYQSKPRAQPATRFNLIPDPVAGEPAPPADVAFSESDLASDLEAELMRDLEASFAAVRAPLQSPKPAPDLGPAITDEPDFDAFADMHLRRSVRNDAPLPAPNAGIESLATWRESNSRINPRPSAPIPRARLPESGPGAPAVATPETGRFDRRSAARDPLSAEPEIAAAAAAAEAFGQITSDAEERTPSFESFIDADTPDEYPPVPGYGAAGRKAGVSQTNAARRPGGMRPLAIVGSLLGVAFLGALGFIVVNGLGGGETDLPPIITADAGPTKIAPANPGGAPAPEQSKLIYDRVGVAGDAGEAALAADETVTTVPRPDVQRTDASREISRIILPNSGDPLLPDEESTSRSAAEEAPAAVGPKRVRTVVVRPDGTIVSSTSSPAAASPDAAAASAQEPPATVALADTALPSSQPSEVPDDPVHGTASVPAAEPDPMALEEDFESDDPFALDAPQEPDAIAETPPGRTAPSAAAPAARGTGPISLLPKPDGAGTQTEPAVAAVEPAAPAQRATSAGGSYFVQVSSQRSESQALAAYREMQKRFPSILGDREPDIQRADLGSRGIYYRARVAPGLSSGEAASLCTSLKSAGGDCIVTQN